MRVEGIFSATWQCGLFLAYCFLFVIIVKCLVTIAAVLIEKLYFATFSSAALYRLAFKLVKLLLSALMSVIHLFGIKYVLLCTVQ